MRLTVWNAVDGSAGNGATVSIIAPVLNNRKSGVRKRSRRRISTAFYSLGTEVGELDTGSIVPTWCQKGRR